MHITVIDNCRIFDGVSSDVIEGGAVVMEDSRIMEVAALFHFGVRRAA